jgi:hypothetical protein
MSGISPADAISFGQANNDDELVTKSYFEELFKTKQKQDAKTDAKRTAQKQKTIGEIFGSYKQQIRSGVLDPLSASQAFKEEAKGYGGPAKRTRLSTELADLRPIPGYDPKTYNKRKDLIQQKKDIEARPQTWEEKADKLENRGVNIQEKIDALLGSEDYDPTPNRQAEKDIFAQLQKLKERQALIDPEKDKARADKLRARAAAFDPEKATSSLTKRIGELAPGVQYKEMVSGALSTQANLLGLGKGIVTPQLEKSLIQQAKAQGITASEMPSYMREQLSSSQITRPYLLTADQEKLQLEYGNIGRDKSGLISNTYQSILPGNQALASSYGLKPGQGMSIGDIEHLKNVDMQNVVNAGMAKVENIRGMSSMLGLIGYALS